jgi:diaminopimelate decarboxylase
VDHFVSRDGSLYAEDVSLTAIAEQYGTPTYVYSHATIQRHVRVLSDAMGTMPHLLCYAIKANSNLAVLETITAMGGGLDAVSVGELARGLKVGCPPKRIIVSGVGKRDDEIASALAAGVLYISVESMAELTAVAGIARQMGVKARVSVRVNPDVDAATHPYISTGLRENKFGVPLAMARALYARGVALAELDMVGITCHIGSQITTVAPFIDAAGKIAELARELIGQAVPIRYIGIGGGLGIPYAETDTPPAPSDYGEALRAKLAPLGLTLVLEPGRVIVGNAGVLLTRVVRTKEGADRQFVIVDAGMNDLIRPALYEARHAIEAVTPRTAPRERVTVVGPVCESADTFARDVSLPRVVAGDLLVFRSAGAYGFAMSSTYNARPRAAEVMVSGTRAVVVRERETIAELWRGEHALSGAAFDATLPKGLTQ